MRDVLEQAVALGKTHTHEGAVATYIPELGKVDGSQLGVSVFCRNGKRISVGDTKVRFSIQSISKSSPLQSHWKSAASTRSLKK